MWWRWRKQSRGSFGRCLRQDHFQRRWRVQIEFWRLRMPTMIQSLVFHNQQTTLPKTYAMLNAFSWEPPPPYVNRYDHMYSFWEHVCAILTFCALQRPQALSFPRQGALQGLPWAWVGRTGIGYRYCIRLNRCDISWLHLCRGCIPFPNDYFRDDRRIFLYRYKCFK